MHFKDPDIQELWGDSNILYINYSCDKAGTSYSRQDLLNMLAVLDGKIEGICKSSLTPTTLPSKLIPTKRNTHRRMK